MKKLLLGLLVSILLITGCTSVTKTGALGIDRQQLMLVSYEKMDKISAEAYVKALKEARDLVNPAYTSIIGKEKYSENKKLNVHTAASYVIGRRALNFIDNRPV